LIVVDKILTAGGKKIKGSRGGSIEVIEVTNDKNGNHQVRFKLENPPGTAAGTPNQMPDAAVFLMRGKMANPMIAKGPAPGSNLSLVDANGVAFPLMGSFVTNHNGDVVQGLTFQAQQGRVPAKLIFSAQRNVNVDIPFRFKDLKLP
jgi:hypothetical protein